MKMVSIITGIIAAILLVLTSISGELFYPLAIFIDLPSLLWVVFLPLLILALSNKVADFFGGLIDMFRIHKKKENVDRKEKVLKLSRYLYFLSAGLISLINLVQAISHSMTGGLEFWITMAFLPFIYAIILSLVAVIAEARLKQ